MVGAPRDAHLHKVLASWGKGKDMQEMIAKSKVLIVGAGGIGCELLKVLVLSGFKDLEIVDLDTIDVSNLNRQFLFRMKHVGQPKALVAAEKAKEFNPDISIIPHHGNIKDKKFGVQYMVKFDVVFNALDNIEARRHVNRVCVAAERPLVDGGTQGYDGQVTTIVKGKTECYDCEPKPAPKGYPVCTIRTTPDKPIHCIVWGKHLFALLFGTKDDANEVATIDPAWSGEELLRQLYVAEIEKLAENEKLWSERRPPAPLDVDTLAAASSSRRSCRAARNVLLQDDQVWDLEAFVEYFLTSFAALRMRWPRGGAEFDKDDDDAMDFVLAAANLRAAAFGIETVSRFRCKSIAGNIIPAIATTNAIIAGAMVMEAFKVVHNRLKDCRTMYKRREPSGKNQQVLMTAKIEEPNKNCAVCSQAGATQYLRINTKATTLATFLARVLKGELGFNEPLLDTGDNTLEFLASFDDPQEARQLEAKLGLPLSDPAVGITHQASVAVQDESQGDCKVTLVMEHSDEYGEDKEKLFTLQAKPFSDEGGVGAAASGGADEDRAVEVAEAAAPAGSKRARGEGDGLAGDAPPAARGRKA